MRLKQILVIITILLVKNFSSQVFTFQNFNHKQGLSLSDINIIRQDVDGYLWVGTFGAGIQRFDGKSFDNSNEVNNNEEYFVNYLYSNDKEIYFSSRYSGFYKFDKKRYELLNFPNSFIGEFICIHPVGNKFFLSGSNGISLCDLKKEYDYVKFATDLEDKIPIQIIEKGGLLFVIFKNKSYVIQDNKILDLNDWLGLNKNTKISFASFNNESIIHFYNLNNNQKYSVSLNKDGKKTSTITSLFIHPKINSVKTVYAKNNQLIIADSTNQLFYFKNQKLKQIKINYKNKSIIVKSLFIDNNNDFWVCTHNLGLLKISLEAFSKIQFNSFTLNPLISYIYISKDKQIFLSDFGNKTYIGNFENQKFSTNKLRIYGQCDYQEKTLFASNLGIKTYENGKFTTFNNIKEKIIFIFSANNRLYYCIEGKGLFEYYNDKSKNIINRNLCSHIYTAQYNYKKNKIYFGTNVGIFIYDINNFFIQPLHKIFNYPRGYSGVSTKDVFGNFWFSSGKSLIYISSNEKIKAHEELKSLTSNLFYTLNSDNLSQIWLGTNKGLNKIKINKNGDIKKIVQFTKENGFDGHETHMRSSFQENNSIYIGTIEGLYLVNPEILEQTYIPPPPNINFTILKNAKHDNDDNNLIYLYYVSVNAKFKNIKYSYRIKGKVDNWTPLSKDNEIYFANIESRNYLFEVKASYDGINYSKTSTYEIKNNLPFWKSNWFIILIVLTIAFLNIFFLEKTKTFTLFKEVYDYNTELSKLTKIAFISFGWISSTLVNYFANYLDNTIVTNDIINIILSILLLLLIILNFLKIDRGFIEKNSLKIGLYLILLHSYIGAYISNIHPFYLIIICICFAVIPIAIKTYNEQIAFGIIQIVLSCAFIFLLKNTIYNKALFLIAIIVSFCISIFNSYIRNESINKFHFVSFLVNKGKFFALSFDGHFKIKFMSEGLINLLGSSSIDLYNNSLTGLNKYVVENIKNKILFGRDLLTLKKIVVPMKTKLNKHIWIEWTLYKLNKNKYVILGQNINNQIDVENENYLLNESENEMIFEIDVYGNLIKSNKLFNDTFGVKNENNNKNIFNILSVKDKESIIRFFRKQFIERILTTKKEIICYNKFGEKILLNLSLTLFFDSSNTKIVKKIFCRAINLTQDTVTFNKIKTIESKYNELRNSLIELNDFDSKNKKIITDKFSQFYKISFNKSEVISDFDFIEKSDNNIFIITGSFVNSPPHAYFLSPFIKSSIKYLIQIQKVVETNKILTIIEENYKARFDEEFINKNKIELEIQIIRYNTENKSIYYSTAGGQFLNNRNGDIILQKGESRLLFDKITSNFKEYHNYEIKINKCEYIILFSAGIFNKENYINDQEINLLKILNFFKENKNLSLEEQLIILQSLIEKNIKFERYKCNFEVIAIKF